MTTGTITCPNCGSAMNAGDPCPGCDHENDGACTCDYCLMSVPSDEEEDENAP